MDKEPFDIDADINAQWCVDSETGEKVLIDRKTNQILYRLPRNCKCIEDNKPSKQD